jgi:hypothetical protein
MVKVEDYTWGLRVGTDELVGDCVWRAQGGGLVGWLIALVVEW